MTTEPLYVTDTNALYWYLTKDKKLSKDAQTIFQAAKQGERQIVISAMVIAELYYLDKKWNVFKSSATIYNDLKKRDDILLVPLKADEILDFDTDAVVLKCTTVSLPE